MRIVSRDCRQDVFNCQNEYFCGKFLKRCTYLPSRPHDVTLYFKIRRKLSKLERQSHDTESLGRCPMDVYGFQYPSPAIHWHIYCVHGCLLLPLSIKPVGHQWVSYGLIDGGKQASNTPEQLTFQCISEAEKAPSLCNLPQWLLLRSQMLVDLHPGQQHRCRSRECNI